MPSYNPDKGAVKGLADRGRAKILRHMGGRGIKFDSTTDKGIKGLGNPDAEGKYILYMKHMNKYEDKEASMDDYSHERKLRIDGRYEAAHGKMANAKNDFDHAHALKKDAHYDAENRRDRGYRHPILKHNHSNKY